MKKSIKKFYIVILSIFIPMSFVYADNISITCPNEIKKGESFNCEVSGYTDTSVTSIELRGKLSGALSFVGFIPNNDWLGDGDLSKIGLYRENALNNSFKIGTLKLKNNGNGYIFFDTILFYDSEDKENKLKTYSKNIQVVVDNEDSGEKDKNEENSSKEEETNVNSTYLLDIKIDGYSIDFNKDTFEYDLKIGNEKSLVINPILEDKSSSFVIYENSDLENGSSIVIEIIGEDNSGSTIYKINIIKEDEVYNEEKKNSNISKYIFALITFVLILINIFRIIRNKNNKSE